jgi:transcriptional regulator with XRE-family HTH domain
MQERLQQILEQERLTPARFAELVGVQRSSVSHILSGRNKPSLDFLQKIMAEFEHISPDWLILGKGPYKRSEIKFSSLSSREVSKPSKKEYTGLFKFPPPNQTKTFPPEKEQQEKKSNIQNLIKEREENKITEQDSISENTNSKFHLENPEATDDKKSLGRKKITKTILFYDDHTFEVFHPGD